MILKLQKLEVASERYVLTQNKNKKQEYALHKKMKFSINEIFPVSCGFGHIYWRNPEWKTSGFCAVTFIFLGIIEANLNESINFAPHPPSLLPEIIRKPRSELIS